MLLSIVTVVKNNARGLRHTGRSLQVQQQPADYEWIVIDGASTDDTAAVMTEFADLSPRFISEADDGLYHAMNKGVDLATGEYVWFLNGGDCLPDAFTLRDVKRAIASHFKPDFFYGDARENGIIKRAHDFDKMKHGQITHHQAMLYNRKAIGGTRFDTQYQIAADYDFTLRVAGRMDRIHYEPRVLCDFASGGLSQQKAEQGRLENDCIRREVLGMSVWRSLMYVVMDEWTFNLKTNYPRLYRFLRKSIMR